MSRFNYEMVKHVGSINNAGFKKLQFSWILVGFRPFLSNSPLLIAALGILPTFTECKDQSSRLFK